MVTEDKRPYNMFTKEVAQADREDRDYSTLVIENGGIGELLSLIRESEPKKFGIRMRDALGTEYEVIIGEFYFIVHHTGEMLRISTSSENELQNPRALIMARVLRLLMANPKAPVKIQTRNLTHEQCLYQVLSEYLFTLKPQTAQQQSRFDSWDRNQMITRKQMPTRNNADEKHPTSPAGLNLFASQSAAQEREAQEYTSLIVESGGVSFLMDLLKEYNESAFWITGLDNLGEEFEFTLAKHRHTIMTKSNLMKSSILGASRLHIGIAELIAKIMRLMANDDKAPMTIKTNNPEHEKTFHKAAIKSGMKVKLSDKQRTNLGQAAPKSLFMNPTDNDNKTSKGKDFGM